MWIGARCRIALVEPGDARELGDDVCRRFLSLTPIQDDDAVSAGAVSGAVRRGCSPGCCRGRQGRRAPYSE
jgi:hypothetical protein